MVDLGSIYRTLASFPPPVPVVMMESRRPDAQFKKLLNKELNQILDGDKISSQISDYICSTFLDQDESEQAPPAPSDSNNNNVSQPNEKSVQNTLTAEKVRRMVPTSLLVRVGSSRGGGDAGSPSSGTSANATEDSQKTVVVLGTRPFSVTVPLQTSATASLFQYVIALFPARFQFKKLLNKELNQILDGDKISSQISDYICSTFLDQDESEQAPPAPSDSYIRALSFKYSMRHVNSRHCSLIISSIQSVINAGNSVSNP
nr:unnamed protein product [Spirometra erinaceieuropaei]